MINVDLKGLISGIINIFDVSTQLYDAVYDTSSLPRSLRDVADRLPAIQHTLEVALQWLAAAGEDLEQYIALSRMLESCRNKAINIQNILQSVISDANTSLISRCAKAIKAISLANTVESLMQSILHDLQVLAANRTVNLASRS